MPSTTASGRGQISARQWLWAAAIAIALALFIAAVVNTASGYRALVEHERLNEMAAESRALCEKWGMPQGTARHAECLADLQAVRDRHAARILEDAEPF